MHSGSLHPIPPESADIDRLLYRSAIGGIGAFRCPPNHPRFTDSGPIRDACVVFPRTATRIQHSGRSSFHADPTIVTLYNAGQTYRRFAVSPEGDHCDYLSLTPQALDEALRLRGTVMGRAPSLFPRSHVHGPATLYLQQRRLFRGAQRADAGDRLALDEGIVTILDAVIGALERVQAWAPAVESRANRRAIDLADAARHVIATHLTDPLPLAAIAQRLGCSSFHLCRVFRQATGLTLHQYRHDLRLRRALGLIEQGADLSAAALALGYSSHSHFTAAFSRRFGVTPSAVRERAATLPIELA